VYSEKRLGTPDWVKAWFEKKTWRRIDAHGHEFMKHELKCGPYTLSDHNYPLPGIRTECVVGPAVNTVQILCSVSGIEAVVALAFDIGDETIT
jgi:hypothetical protein